jgi:hypothetical protein
MDTGADSSGGKAKRRRHQPEGARAGDEAFDALTKAAAGDSSRRRTLRLLGQGTATALVASLLGTRQAVAKECLHVCKADADCPSKRCVSVTGTDVRVCVHSGATAPPAKPCKKKGDIVNFFTGEQCCTGITPPNISGVCR